MTEPTDHKPAETANPLPEASAPVLEEAQPSGQSGQSPEEEPPTLPESNHDLATTYEPPKATTQPTETTQQVSANPPNEGTTESGPASKTGASIEASLPAMDHSLPAMDTSQSFMDAGVPSFDSELPSVGSSAAPDLSLPAIDTTLPTLDSSLPAIGTDIPTMDAHHSFGENDHFESHDSPADSGSQIDQQNSSTHYQSPPNGNYQYAHSSTPLQQHGGQQTPQPPSQQQFQPQPQHNYQHQSSDIYHHSGAFSTVNANSGHQGQPGQIPQAAIGSPMPPMASMGQYMTGYPSNIPQPGMNSSAQMRYSLAGDANKMLSSARHKKEVKRRTKTGCLTCRKRRIKVCVALCSDTLAGRRPRLCPRTPLSSISSPA